MKKLILLAAFFAATTMGAFAQQADTTIVFDKTTHDFGNIEMKGGPQTYTFEFVNKGKTPIIIQNVTASCGCTIPGWTKEPIAPGARGYVKATYNPSGTMPFDKNLVVYSDAKPAAVVLRIRGKVVDTVSEKK